MDMDDAPQEVLENAPRGHFPAYITPNEAETLRSQGGGVAPGGGQYMVGGIPTYWGPGDSGEGDPGGVGTGPGTGGDAGGVGGDGSGGDDTGPADDPDEGEDIGGIDAAEAQAAAAAANAAANAAAAMEADFQAQAKSQAQAAAVAQAQAAAVAAQRGPPDIAITNPDIAAAVAAISAQDQAEAEAAGGPTTEAESRGFDLGTLAGQVSLTESTPFQQEQSSRLGSLFANASRAKNRGVDNQQVQTENLDSLQSLVEEGIISNTDALGIAGLGISSGGLGGQSPGGFAANNSDEDLTIDDIAAINALDPVTGQYAVNLPAPEPGTPTFDVAVNASTAYGQAFPGAAAVIGGLAGLVPGGSLMTAASLLSGQNTGITGLFPGLSEVGATAGQTISDVLGGVSNALDTGFGALGDAAGGLAESIGFSPDGTSSGGGGFDGGFDGGGVDGGGPPPLPTVPETPATPATPTVPETLDEVDLTLLPAVAQNLPPARRPTTPFSTFGQPTLPPVFTEQDARALLQQTGQLPLAGIA